MGHKREILRRHASRLPVRRFGLVPVLAAVLLLLVSACRDDGADDSQVIAAEDGATGEDEDGASGDGSDDGSDDDDDGDPTTTEVNDQTDDDDGDKTDTDTTTVIEPPELERHRIAVKFENKEYPPTTDDLFLETTTSFFDVVFEATSPSSSVQIVSIGPSDVCEPGAPLMLWGGNGDICQISLLAPAADEYQETEVTVHITFKPLYYLDWSQQATAPAAGSPVRPGAIITVTLSAIDPTTKDHFEFVDVFGRNLSILTDDKGWPTRTVTAQVAGQEQACDQSDERAMFESMTGVGGTFVSVIRPPEPLSWPISCPAQPATGDGADPDGVAPSG